MTSEVVVFRPGFGRGLTVLVVAGCVVGGVSALLSDPGQAWRYLPLLALACVAVWAAYWNPAVIVTPAAVELRNVTRTIVLPWPCVQSVDTSWALTVQTAYGTFAAWAAPAPSRTKVSVAQREDVTHLPETSYGAGGSVRPGDLASTDSGQAAAIVRARWQQQRDAGVLDDPRLEHARPVVRWHVATLATLAVLAVLSVVTLVL